MNQQAMERILRQAPIPKAPRELEARLIAEIQIGRGESGKSITGGTRGLKRWLPVFSYGGLAAGCLAAALWQGSQLAELRRENETLRAQTQGLDALRQANAEVEKWRGLIADLGRLRRDKADIPRLQNEIARLHGEIGDTRQLRDENQRLRSAAAAIPGVLPDFFGQMKERAEQIACVNNLKQLGLAARLWADNHHGQLPSDFISMSNELSSWRVLQDPGDARSVTNWAQVASGEVAYKIDVTGMTLDDAKATPNIVLYECPRHHIVCLLDGSVQQLNQSALANQSRTDEKEREVLGVETDADGRKTAEIVTDAKGRKMFVPLN